MDAVVKRKILSPRRESNPARPVCSLVCILTKLIEIDKDNNYIDN
jgi:hypothetical protein